MTDQDQDRAELRQALDEYHQLMRDPVTLAGMILERLEAMRAAGQLPPPQ